MEELEIPEAIFDWLDSDEFNNAVDKFCETFLVTDENRTKLIEALVKFVNKKITLNELVLKLTMVTGEEATKAEVNIKKFLYDNFLSPIESYLWLINVDLLEIGGKEKDEKKIKELKALAESVYEEEDITSKKTQPVIEKSVIAPENVPLAEQAAPITSILKNDGAPVMLHEFKEEVQAQESKPELRVNYKAPQIIENKKAPVKAAVSGLGMRVVHYSTLMSPITQATLVSYAKKIEAMPKVTEREIKIPKPQSKWFR